MVTINDTIKFCLWLAGCFHLSRHSALHGDLRPVFTVVVSTGWTDVPANVASTLYSGNGETVNGDRVEGQHGGAVVELTSSLLPVTVGVEQPLFANLPVLGVSSLISAVYKGCHSLSWVIL